MKQPGTEPSPWLSCGIIVAAVAAAYSDCMQGVYVLDDPGSIADNPSIRHLTNLGAVLSPPALNGVTVSGRPVLNLSFALNYAISGTASWSYHLANIAIHIAAALALLGILRRLASPGLAFVVALLWAVHPLDTESVTYVVQRAESMMGLFYLLTIYCFIRGAEPSFASHGAGATADEKAGAQRQGGWLILSVFACLFGMGTKEVMVSAPLLVLLIDRFHVSGSFGEAWRRHKGYYLALASTWILLGFEVWHTQNRGGTSGFGTGISVWKYWATQPTAIMRYLKLAVVPYPLVFDYGTEWTVNGTMLAASLVVIGALVGITLHGLVKNRPAGVVGFVFFAILAPTSLIPGVRQTAAEHRMYLALIPVLLVVVAVLRRALSWRPLRSAYLWLSLLAVPAAAATYMRNRVYWSAVRLYGDAAAKMPDNVYAQTNYATALLFAHRYPEAEKHFQISLRLYPLPYSENNLGNIYFLEGRYDLAEVHYRRAIALSVHGFADAHDNLAEAFLRQNRVADARREVETALRLNPDLGGAHANLGDVLLREGHMDQALGQFALGVKLDPSNVDARVDYANALRLAHRPLDALQQYYAAAQADPLEDNVFYNWAGALLELGRLPQAKKALRIALQLNPQNQAARKTLDSLPAGP